MPLTQTNYNPGNNYNSQNGGNPQQPNEKRNFGISRIYGTDGVVDISLWKSPNNVFYTSINIKQLIGKDPNGRSNFEAGLAKDIPNVLVRADQLGAILMDIKKPVETIDAFFVTQSKDAKPTITFKGSAEGVTITIESPVGKRSTTIAPTPSGNHNVHSNFNNLILVLEMCLRKCILNRADADIVAGSEDTPF